MPKPTFLYDFANQILQKNMHSGVILCVLHRFEGSGLFRDTLMRSHKNTRIPGRGMVFGFTPLIRCMFFPY